MNRNVLISRAVMGVAATAAALILTACGTDTGSAGNAGSGSSSMSAMPGMDQSSSAAVKSWNDADVRFAQAMIDDHQMVAKMASLAATKASSPQLRALARQMKTGQSQAVDKLTGWLKAWGNPSPGDMAGMTMPGAMTDADMAKLKSMTGMDFDMMFAQMMIAHHNGSIQMARDEQTNGRSAEAKAMAAAMIKTEAAQVAELKKLTHM